MILPNHFWNSWYCPTAELPKGGKLLKPLPAVKGILSCNSYKQSPTSWASSTEHWDSPPPCHSSWPLPSLDLRIQAFFFNHLFVWQMLEFLHPFGCPSLLPSPVLPWPPVVQGPGMHTVQYDVTCVLKVAPGPENKRSCNYHFFFLFSLFGSQAALGHQVSDKEY